MPPAPPPAQCYLVFNTTFNDETIGNTRLIAIPMRAENIRALQRQGTLDRSHLFPYVIDGHVNSTSRVVLRRPPESSGMHVSSIDLICRGTQVHGYGRLNNDTVFSLDGLNLANHSWTREAINGQDRFPNLPDTATIVLVALGQDVRHIGVPLDHALAEHLADAPFGTSFIEGSHQAYLLDDTYETHSARQGRRPLSEVIPDRPAGLPEPVPDTDPRTERTVRPVTTPDIDRVDLLLRNGFLHGYLTLTQTDLASGEETSSPYRLIGVEIGNHPFLSNGQVRLADRDAIARAATPS